MRERFDALLGSFGRRAGIADLRTEEDGSCTIGYGENIFVLRVDESAGFVRVYCALALAPAGEASGPLLALLRQNANLDDAFPIYMALDAEEQAMLLMAHAPLSAMSDESFAAFLAAVEARASAWRELLESLPSTEESAAVVPPLGTINFA
jgi:hypothetical protein